MSISKFFRNGQRTQATRRKDSTGARPVARLGLETLEARDTPTGVVNISFANNAITLTGDGNVTGNNVTMTATGDDTNNNSQFTFTSGAGTQFSVNGGPLQASVDTANVNGFFFPNNGSTKLNANFGAGNDTFNYNGAESANIFVRWFGDITVNSGAGNDTVQLYSSFGKNFAVNTGAGNDSLNVLSGAIVGGTPYNGGASGAFTATLGTGTDYVDLGISTNKNVTVNASDADDQIFANYTSRIGGSLLINVATTPVPGTTIIGIGNGTGGAAGITSIADDLIIKNGNNRITLFLGLAFQPLNVGRNLTVVSGSDAVTGSLYNLSAVNVGKAISVTGGTGLDRLNNGSLNSGTSMTFNMGNGGNGAGDNVGTLNVGGNLVMNYGSGNDNIFIPYADVGGSTTINAGVGQDTINLSALYSGTTFAYNGGEGGNGGIGNPDLINLPSNKGNVTITSGGGNDAFTISGLLLKNLTVSTGSGSDTVNLNGTTVLGNLAVTTGLGDDTVNAAGLLILGSTSILTGGGSDTLNMTGTSRYHLKVTINLGGTGTDDDMLFIAPANVGEEMLLLKGLAVVSGLGNDILNGGNGGGIVMVHNGLSLPNNFNYGNNFFSL
jgi:hypothetical protein